MAQAKLTLWLLFIITAAAIPLIFKYNNEEPISCHSELTLINNNIEYNLFYTFSADHGKGVLTFSSTDKNKSNDIVIVKNFSYERKADDIYILRNYLTEMNSNYMQFPEVFNDILPSFFTKNREDDALPIKIIKTKNSGWVFTSEKTPYLFCEKNNS